MTQPPMGPAHSLVALARKGVVDRRAAEAFAECERQVMRLRAALDTFAGALPA